MNIYIYNMYVYNIYIYIWNDIKIIIFNFDNILYILNYNNAYIKHHYYIFYNEFSLKCLVKLLIHARITYYTYNYNVVYYN